MNMELERSIFKAFFYPNKYERMLFDLNKSNKQFITKLSQYSLYISEDLIIDEINKKRTLKEIFCVMKEYDAVKQCYVFSEYPQFHRKYVNLQDLEVLLSQNSFASLTVGLPSGFSYYRGESIASFQPSFFLKPKERLDELPWAK